MPQSQNRLVNGAHAFWTWFEKSEASIRGAYGGGDSLLLDSLLSERVADAAAGAGWELGPYALPLNALVISPGTRERVPACRTLVEAAPDIAGWRFFAGKPPKELLSLTIDISGHAVCADRWRYRLTRYGGGEFVDVEIFFEECDAPEPVDSELASQLFVEALVGEMVSLERVGCIECACVPSIEVVERATPLRYLKRHLDDVLTPMQ
jgi:hypothetical protein